MDDAQRALVRSQLHREIDSEFDATLANSDGEATGADFLADAARWLTRLSDGEGTCPDDCVLHAHETGGQV